MGIGNNVRVSLMIPRVVNGNGNDVLASRLPWRDEHQRAGAELALRASFHKVISCSSPRSATVAATASASIQPKCHPYETMSMW